MALLLITCKYGDLTDPQHPHPPFTTYYLINARQLTDKLPKIKPYSLPVGNNVVEADEQDRHLTKVMVKFN